MPITARSRWRVNPGRAVRLRSVSRRRISPAMLYLRWQLMANDRVLIIEDDPALSRGLKDNFEAQGYHVELASDGQKGLEAALANKSDLIVLDIMLPRVNGYEICREVR